MDSKRIPIELEEGEVLEMYFTSHAEAWDDVEKKQNAVKRVIDKIELLAEGGSSLVYLVHFSDDKTDSRWILKEFYPASEEYLIKREGRDLIVNEENQSYQQMKESFRRGYERLRKLASHKDAAEYTTGTVPEGFAECNNTMYLLLPYKCTTSFKMDSVPIVDVYDVLIRATQSLHIYHQCGYLYLDLKPDNILYHKPQKYIELFDCDTVLQKEELGKIGYQLRSTPAYCAPEVMTAQQNGFTTVGCIDEKSDLYTVGAMLYHAIFKKPFVRTPDFRDTVEAWSEIINKEESLERFSFEYKQRLAVFFYKTLHWRRLKRFSSADEIICELNRLRVLSEQDIFLHSSVLEEDIFVGREQELEKLYSCLEHKHTNSSVVLVGKGGIGKSALARQYARTRIKNYRDDDTTGYDSVLIGDFEKCNGDMNILLESIFDKYVNKIYQEDIGFENKCKCLKDICKRSKVLVIIDNFDVEMPKNKKDFCEIGWNVIYTSRYRLKEYGNLINVKELDLDVLLSLFEKYYCLAADISEKKFSKSEQMVIKKIIEKYSCHTLLVELLARISGKYLIEVNKLSELFEAKSDMRVNYSKDGNAKKQSVQEALSDLFSVFKNTENENAAGYLSIEEIKTLFNLSLLRMSVNEDEFIRLSGIKKKGILAELSEKGWVESIGNDSVKIYTIPPVIGEAIYQEMMNEPDSLELCGNLILNTKTIFRNKLKNMKVHSIGTEDVRCLQFMARVCDDGLMLSQEIKADIFLLRGDWNVMCKQYEIAKRCYESSLLLYEESGILTDEERTNIEYKIDLMEATNSWAMSIEDLNRIRTRVDRIYYDMNKDVEIDMGIARILRDYYITVYDIKHANELSELIKREREKYAKLEVDESILDTFRDGITFLNNEVYDCAADEFSRSLEFIESQMRLLKKEMAKINAHYGRTLGEMGRDGSVAACKSSVRIRKELAQQGDESEKKKLWISEYNLSKAYYLAGDFLNAANTLNNAWDNYENYGEKNVSNESSLICMQGRIKIARQDWDGGIKDLKDAMDLRSRGRGKDSPWTGQIANWLAEAYEEQGMYKEALENANIRKCSLEKNQSYNNERKLFEVLEMIERIRRKMADES